MNARNLFILILTVFSLNLQAQFFGKNKPRYRSFDFKVMESEHYDIYYYMKNKEVIDRLGQWSEMWYDHHYAVFQDSIKFKNPILFYNNHADFQQNNAISSSLGPGTGGVTEAFKNRVVMPITFTHQQTNHVLGHELVHAFQFNNVVRGDSTSLRSLANLPLWMSEGLAEYLSLGSEDSQTAMWMRDAVANEDIPAIKDLFGYQYFPYRYGHALWAFMTGYYGDGLIGPLYHATAKRGLAIAIDSLMGVNHETLSGMWKSALKINYKPLLANRSENPKGRVIVDSKKNVNINVSPVISPNGKYFVYLSNKDLISTDLFLASARDGETIKKLVSISKAGADHIDYLESTGSWSPNSKEFVYVIFKKGKNALVIVDVESGKSGSPIFIDKAPALTNPSWSPDGRTIVFTGKKEGQVDLYAYNIKSGRTERLTNDIYSEIAPKHSPDGTKLLFSYDKRSFDSETYDGMYTLDLAEMDLASQRIDILDLFHGADNTSASYTQEGDILFASDRDGFKDIYLFKTDSLKTYQLSSLKTGVSGITRYSPCITTARKIDLVLSSVYYNRSYRIVKSQISKLDKKLVDNNLVNKYAAKLPVKNPESKHVVDRNLSTQSNYQFASADNFKDKEYKAKFQLDYIGGGAGVGVSNNTFGNNTALQGGVQMLFSDILGNNQLFTNLAVNGEFLDFGGQVSYINRKNRLAYGFGLGHVPQRTGFQTLQNDQIQIDGQVLDVVRSDINILRLFNESATAFVHLPFSTSLRLEGGLSGFYQHFRADLIQDYYALNALNQFVLIGQERTRLETGDRLQLNQYYTLTKGFGAGANLALVGDKSVFGFTGPINGHRFRIGLENQIGIDNFIATVADFRKYSYVKPFTFALRVLNYNRFENETSTVYPFYIGSWGFVRGYEDLYSDSAINPEINFDRMIGSKIGLVSAEIRMPFFGPRPIGLINTGFLLSDLVLFVDAGVSFDTFDQLQNGRPTSVIATDEGGNIIYDSDGFPVYEIQTVKPLLATSAGVSMRINIGNTIIIEPYYARQLVKNGRWDFGLNFIPGW